MYDSFFFGYKRKYNFLNYSSFFSSFFFNFFNQSLGYLEDYTKEAKSNLLLYPLNFHQQYLKFWRIFTGFKNTFKIFSSNYNILFSEKILKYDFEFYEEKELSKFKYHKTDALPFKEHVLLMKSIFLHRFNFFGQEIKLKYTLPKNLSKMNFKMKPYNLYWWVGKFKKRRFLLNKGFQYKSLFLKLLYNDFLQRRKLQTVNYQFFIKKLAKVILVNKRFSTSFGNIFSFIKENYLFKFSFINVLEIPGSFNFKFNGSIVLSLVPKNINSSKVNIKSSTN